MSIPHLPRTVAAAAALTLALAACGGDDDSSSTTSTAADGSTTTESTTTTTISDSLPTVSELWTEPVDDSGPDVDAKVYMTIQGGATDDTLTGVSVDPDLAASAALTPESSVQLPATTTVNLEEDGTHIVLEGLAAPLEYDRAFHVTLSFDSAPDQRVEGAVRDPSDPES
jgi:copper(I)-binding protein